VSDTENVSAILALCAVVFLIAAYAGCSDSNTPSEPEEPQGIRVNIAPTDLALGITESYEFAAAVSGGVTNEVVWYVDDIEGGNTTVGTITQSNPATYVAPDGVPPHGTIEVRAVSTEDTTRADSCEVTVTFDRIHVNAVTGDDDTGIGGRNKPYKTITKGLSIAPAGMVVMAAPGVYDVNNGERFPISIPDSVVLEGEDWESCIIRVDAEELALRYPLTITCSDCAIRKFTFEENELVEEDYWNYAVYLMSCRRALADSLRCLERARHFVLRVSYDDHSIVQNCYFDVTDGRRDGWGIEISFNEEGNGTVLRGSTVSGYGVALDFVYPQNTLVESCDLSGNNYGVYLCCYEDPLSQPNPDFGGGARGSLGGNDFSNNRVCGLMNTTANAIYARYNTWGNTPPIDGRDYCNQEIVGDVITE